MESPHKPQKPTCVCVCVCVCVYDSSWNCQMFMKWLRVHWLNFADISHFIFNLFGNTDCLTKMIAEIKILTF